MQNNKNQFASEIKNKKYIDNYIEKWLKLETLDEPYVECEICGYASNASIHQHLFPQEFGLNSGDSQIVHLCANCYHELRALIDKYDIVQERTSQMYGEAFENLKKKKKHYRDANKNLKRVEI